MDELENNDLSKGDSEMVTYWLRKYIDAKSHNERRNVRLSANAYLEGESLGLFLDECIKWHSDIMDKSIFTGKKSGV